MKTKFYTKRNIAWLVFIYTFMATSSYLWCFFFHNDLFESSTGRFLLSLSASVHGLAGLLGVLFYEIGKLNDNKK